MRALYTTIIFIFLATLVIRCGAIPECLYHSDCRIPARCSTGQCTSLSVTPKEPCSVVKTTPTSEGRRVLLKCFGKDLEITVPAASRPMPEERAPRVQEELLPLPGREEQFLPLPLREEKPASRWVVPPSLPARPPAMLEMPDSLPPELKLLLPKPGKRRRDRKTLFPDVIEKY